MTLSIPKNNLSELARKQAEVIAKAKELDVLKKELRAEIFSYADDSYTGKEYLLPTTTVTIPLDFLLQFYAGKTDDFVSKVFPSWDTLSAYGDAADVTFILRKKREYMPFSYEDEEVKLSRSPSEPTPELDWESMEHYEPKLFMRIAEPVIKYELNEQALQSLIQEQPAVVDELKKYMISKPPVLRVLASTK